MITPIERDELAAKLLDPTTKVLDAQGPGLFERTHLRGAIHGSIDNADDVLAALGDDLDTEIVVYCTDLRCTGSAQAAELLAAAGYRNIRRYAAGLADWTAAGLPIERNDPKQ